MSHHFVRFTRSRSVLWRRVGPEVVLASPSEEGIEQLSPTAAAVWDLLEVPRTLPELVDRLSAGFEGDREMIAGDVGAFVDDLVARRGIEEVADADA